jgi:hypothetical protein
MLWASMATAAQDDRDEDDGVRRLTLRGLRKGEADGWRKKLTLDAVAGHMGALHGGGRGPFYNEIMIFSISLNICRFYFLSNFNYSF